MKIMKEKKNELRSLNEELPADSSDECICICNGKCKQYCSEYCQEFDL